MEISDILARLKENKKFKEWKSNNKDSELVHVFVLMEPGSDIKYDIGFHDKEKKIMTSFVVDADIKNMEKNESDEIFAKDPLKIKPLNENQVKISFDKAATIAIQLQKEKYPQHTPVKRIAILQNLDIGQVWNMTYITKSFQTLNMKIDSNTGEVLEDSLHQIFNFS